MAVQPDEVTGPLPRPVLGAALAARAALAGAESGRVWALSDAEVEQAMETLAQAHAGTEALLAAVAAEAKSRGLGADQGWDGRDWVRLHGPGLDPRLVGDLDTVAGAAGEPRLAEVVQAVAAGADPDPAAAAG